MRRRRSLFLPALVVVTLGITVAGAARAEPAAHRAQGNGTVDPSLGFTAFRLSASVDGSGTVTGRATFADVPEAGGRLEVDVTCLRVGRDVNSDNGNTRLFAILTGPVVAAANGIGIGRQALIGVIDGDQSTPTPTPDTINADFALDLPASITCENAGLAVDTPVLQGGVRIR
jgi:hypothetical protein